MEQLSIADALDAASACNPFQSRVATLCEPQTIDPFDATNHHGDPVTVRTDADRAVVYSFPNTDGCRCTAQIQQYDALATELNIPVYGLAPAKPDDLFDVAKRFGVVHDLLSDPHGNIAGKVGIPIDVDSGKHKRTTLFLANGEVVERVDGLTAISVRESDDGIRLDERPPIIDTFEHPSVVTIVGKRGAGKSSTAYYIAEQLNQREGLVPVTVGTPEHARSLFPSHWVHADAIQEAPPNSVVVADEAYRFLHAREWQQNDSVEISKLINLSRQCDRTILFVTQSSKQIDGNVPLESDAVVMKEPGALHSRLERREMRPVIEQADDAFGQLPVDQDSRSYAYVMTDDGAEMVPVGEADFFTDALSNAFGGDCGAFDAGEKHDYDDDEYDDDNTGRH